MRTYAMSALTVTLSFSLVGCPPATPELPPPAPPDPQAAAARLVIEPAGALLTSTAPSQPLTARVLDANGAPVVALVTWSSSRPEAVTVDDDGVVTLVALGSAQITATVAGADDDVRATIFAIGAEPVADAVLLRDDEIAGLPTAVDESAQFGVGFRYVVTLASSPADLGVSVGSVVLATGQQSVAGRVVSIDGDAITVEQLAIDDVFARLDIDETFALAELPFTSSDDPLRTQALAEAKVGPFTCVAEGSLGGITLAKSDVALSGVETLQASIVWNDDRRSIVVRGAPKVTFDLEPTLAAALEGTVTCEVILREFQIPLPGPVGIFLGAVIPVGAGLSLGGTIAIGGVGVNLKGDATADLEMGFDCAPTCAAVQTVDVDASLTPTLVAPSVAVKVEPEAQVFAFVRLEGGARFSSTLRIEGINAQAGVKLAASFASEETQAQDPDYASAYALTIEGAVGPGEAVEGFLGMLVGTALSFLSVEVSEPLASSPSGALTANVGSFVTGDDVTFTLTLDPASTSLPLLGYNVGAVRVVRSSLRADQSVSLILANEADVTEGQTAFTIPWVATFDSDDDAGAVFIAYVEPLFLNVVRLEAGSVDLGGAVFDGDLILLAGDEIQATAFATLAEITGNLDIRGAGVARLPKLTKVGAGVEVFNQDALTRVELPLLRDVTFNVQVFGGNDALEAFVAPALASANAVTFQSNAALVDLQLGPAVIAGNLQISQNATLTSLDDVASGMDIGSDLIVSFNPSLPTAEAQDLVSRVTVAGGVDISGNAP